MTEDPGHERPKRYLFVEQPIGAFVVNFALNAGIAWSMFRGIAAVPLWGQPSVAADTVATSFILPFLSVLIVTPLVRRDVRHGKVPMGYRPLLRWLPRATVARALVLGLLGLMVAAPLAVQGLHLAGVTNVPMPAFVWVKATYAAALGAIFAPAIAVTAIASTGAD